MAGAVDAMGGNPLLVVNGSIIAGQVDGQGGSVTNNASSSTVRRNGKPQCGTPGRTSTSTTVASPLTTSTDAWPGADDAHAPGLTGLVVPERNQ